MEKLIGCLFAASLLLFSASTKSGNTPVGAELVPAGTPYSPGILAGDTLYVSGLQGTDPKTHTLPADFGQEAQVLFVKYRARSERRAHELLRCGFGSDISRRYFTIPGSEHHLPGVLQESSALSNDCADRQVISGCSHRGLRYRTQVILRMRGKNEEANGTLR